MEHSHLISAVVWSTFSLLLVALSIQFLARRMHLPFTILLVLVGLAINTLHTRFPEILTVFQALHISPEIILYIFLPALIFESSYNLDARRLIHNIGPVLTMAVPGLLISTLLIGGIVWFATGIPFTVALLLGAILSATDPVAVIAMFREMGAPSRLTTLVEGESLFNDASSIVVAGILIGIVMGSEGGMGGVHVGSAIGDFILLFFGGLLVGIGLGFLTGKIVGWVEADSFIEIGLTTTLAYLSFLMAEEVFHVSGIMATVGAGLTLGSWGRIRISSSVRIYLEHFWKLLAFIANALLFLLVGMTVDLAAMWQAIDILIWVIVAMMVSRAAIVFLLMPLIGKLPGSRPINIAYQFIIYWGGLRGAIALAIVLSLPQFEYSELFVAVVMGAVLFTLLVQGLTIQPMMKWFGLDEQPLADRLAVLELELLARKEAMKQLATLKDGGFFSSRLAHNLKVECDNAISEAAQKLNRLRTAELNAVNEVNLLFLRALTEEKSFYSEMYDHGHLSEGAYRELILVLNLQSDAVRHHGAFAHVHSHRIKRGLELAFFRMADTLPALMPIAERMRFSRIVRDYEQIWAHFLGGNHVIKLLKKLVNIGLADAEAAETVMSKYRSWRKLASEQLYQVSEQFPEFVTAMQQRLGRRMLLLAELEAAGKQAENGLLSEGVAQNLESALTRQLETLRGQAVPPIHNNPAAILARVPLFAELKAEELSEIAGLMQTHSLLQYEVLLEPEEACDALYIIDRGVLNIVSGSGKSRQHGTLLAGEFFGERGLLASPSESGEWEPANLQVRALTPTILSRLEYYQLRELLADKPELAERLTARNEELKALSQGQACPVAEHSTAHSPGHRHPRHRRN